MAMVSRSSANRVPGALPCILHSAWCSTQHTTRCLLHLPGVHCSCQRRARPGLQADSCQPSQHVLMY